jgi:diguanylate cyclase (GGDEF)-like protein
MQLDFPTLVYVGILLGIGAAIGFTSLMLVLRHQIVLRLWVLSLWVATLGIVLIGMRHQIPDVLSIVAGNAALAVANGLMLKGIAMHVGKPLRLRMPVLLVCVYTALMAWFAYIVPNLHLRIVFASAQSVIWDVWFVVLLLRYGQREIRMSCRLAAAVMAFDAVFFSVRIFVPIDPGAAGDIMRAGSPVVITFIVSILTALATYFALLLLITERLMVDLRKLARTDGLTGLLNRTAILAEGRSSLARCRQRKQPFALLIFDLDHFKRINDNWGHEAGDIVLQRFSAIIREGVRWPGSLASRYGGEEFVLTLPGAHIFPAMEVAERLRQALANSPVEVGRQMIATTTSIGVAVAQPGMSFEQLVIQADEALYRAKSEGRNGVTYAPLCAA